MSSYQELETYRWKLQFEALPSNIPRAGQYSAEVTFTLINEIP